MQGYVRAKPDEQGVATEVCEVSDGKTGASHGRIEGHRDHARRDCIRALRLMHHAPLGIVTAAVNPIVAGSSCVVVTLWSFGVFPITIAGDVSEKDEVSKWVSTRLASYPLELPDTRVISFDLKRKGRNEEETMKQQCQVEASPTTVELV